MGLVGRLVKGHQYVELVAGGEHRLRRDPGLGPRGAAHDLGGEGDERHRVIANLGGGLGQRLGGGDHSLPAFSGETHDEVSLLFHGLSL